MTDIFYASLSVLYFKIYQYEILDCKVDYSEIRAYISQQLLILEKEKEVQSKYWHKPFDVIFSSSKIPLEISRNSSDQCINSQFRKDLEILSEMDPKFRQF